MTTPTVSLTVEIPVWLHAILVESAALDEEQLTDYVVGMLVAQADGIVEECTNAWFSRNEPDEPATT